MKTVCSKDFIIAFIFILIYSAGCRESTDNTSSGIPLQDTTMTWLSSIDEARKEAVKSRKLLMIHFFTTWSDWDKKMDRETYNYYKVISLSGNFVCVRIDLDKNPALQDLYGISGTPTVVFEDPVNGKKINKIEGIRDRHEMTDEMNKMTSYKIEGDGK
jgi:thioredoxin-related protein